MRGAVGTAGVHHLRGATREQDLWVALYGLLLPWCGGQVVAAHWALALFAEWDGTEPTMCMIGGEG